MSIRIFMLVALVLASSACSPAPFNPGNDCPKEPNCGQCTSHGGCGFCGGQCLAVGATECPSGWAKAPDMCPEPEATTTP